MGQIRDMYADTELSLVTWSLDHTWNLTSDVVDENVIIIAASIFNHQCQTHEISNKAHHR